MEDTKIKINQKGNIWIYNQKQDVGNLQCQTCNINLDNSFKIWLILFTEGV